MGPKFINECLLRRISVALGAVHLCQFIHSVALGAMSFIQDSDIRRKRIVLGQGYWTVYIHVESTNKIPPIPRLQLLWWTVFSWNTVWAFGFTAPDTQCPRRKLSPKQKISYCLNFPIEYSTCLHCHRGHVTVNKISIYKKGNVYSQNDIEQISVMNYLKKAVKKRDA